MKIVTGYPPNYDSIAAAFNLNGRHPVFTYGDAVFVPSGHNLSYDLRAHEKTHIEQQAAIGAEAWWKRYMTEPSFRLEQEVEAYRNQYRMMSKADKQKHIRRLASDLCSPLYGNIVAFKEAKRLITA